MLPNENIEQLIAVRAAAVARGDTELAELVKSNLDAEGVVLTDSGSGTSWAKKEQ